MASIFRTKGMTCMFRDNPAILMILPPNYIYMRDFLRSSYTPRDEYWLVAMTSTVSFFWIVLLVWRIVYSIRHAEFYYIPPTLSVCSVITLAYAIFISRGFDDRIMFFAPSLRKSIGTAGARILIIISFFTFFYC